VGISGLVFGLLGCEESKVPEAAKVDTPPAKVEEKPCEPRAIYGPRMCGSDEECVQEAGEGYYCDQNRTVDNGCGQKVTWPLCRQK